MSLDLSIFVPVVQQLSCRADTDIIKLIGRVRTLWTGAFDYHNTKEEQQSQAELLHRRVCVFATHPPIKREGEERRWFKAHTYGFGNVLPSAAVMIRW